MNIYIKKFSATVLTASMVLLSFSPIATPVASAANSSSSFGTVTISDPISGSHTLPFTFSCDVNPLYNPVTVSGTATAVAPPGTLSQYHVAIDWGDGNTSDQVELASFGTGHGTSTQNFSATHTYSTNGAQNIVATIYHQNGNGQDNTIDATFPIDTCVFVPPPQTGAVLVFKHVINDNGGTKVASDFSASVTGAAATPSGAFQLSTATTSVTVAAGQAYSVVETPDSGYTPSYSAGCAGTLSQGQIVLCTITNDDNAVINTNHPPTANDLSISTVENTPLNETLTGDDVDGDTITFATSSNPSHGMLSAFSSATGEFTYTPDAGYVGPDSFTFKTNDGQADSNVATVSIDVTAAPPTTGTLVVKKIVVNNSGGTAVSSDFTIHVKNDGTDVPGSPQAGSETGTSYTLAGGTYNVSEDTSGGYSQTFSGDCNSDGTVAVSNGATSTCTLTNTDIAPTLTITKDVVGGDLSPSDFTLTLSGPNEFSESFPGSSTGTLITGLIAGTYTLIENAVANYAGAFSENCSGGVISLALGQDGTCTLTNTFSAPPPPPSADVSITKTVDMTSPVEGDNVTYTIVVVNNGPDSAANVAATDVLPAGLTLVTASPSVGSFDSDTGIWTIGTMTNGDSETLQLTATTGSDTAGENIINTATVTSDTGDSNSDNNDATAPTVTPIAPVEPGQATLTIVKNATGLDRSFDFSVTGSNEFNQSTSVDTVDGTGTTDMGLDAGTYNVTETVPTGWALQNGHPSCTYDNESIGNAITNGETIVVSSGDHVTCTFNDTATAADLTVTKTVDNSTPNVGDQVTYTITVSNAGPADAPDVSVTDVLPAGLTYVSDDSGDTYNTTTGEWSVGSIAGGESKTLHITATVNSGTAGQTIKNDATASVGENENGISDPDSDNNTGSASITVATTPDVTPTPTPTHHGGGGSISCVAGTAWDPSTSTCQPMGQVLGASTSTVPTMPADCSQFLTSYIHFGRANDTDQVARLQYFLNSFESDTLNVSGTYDSSTLAAVNAFQEKYKDQVLTPWGATAPTGYVYYTTRKMVNTIYCHFTKQFPLTSDQQAEIDRIKSLGQSYNPSVTHGATTSAPAGTPTGSAAPQATPTEEQTATEATVGSANDNAAQTAATGNAAPQNNKQGGSWLGNIGGWFSHLIGH